jgi:hypothetical protein
VCGQVVDPTTERVEVLVAEMLERLAAVGFRRADGGDEHRRAR